MLTSSVKATSVWGLAFAATALAASSTKRHSEVTWLSCATIDPIYGVLGPLLNVSATCGYLEVPLDYADDAVGTARLALIKYPATQERWGTLFVNPGGPGESGLEYVFQNGPTISEATGGHYDVVSWDPRGAKGQTYPGTPSCFDSPMDLLDFFSGTLEATGLDIRGNLTDNGQLEEFYSHVDEMEAKYVEWGKRCADAPTGKTLQYVGTAATVRDMVSLADVLEPGVQEINYWGISYGTLLGFTFVNMFPERVGHVILDGCVNPLLYYTKPATEYYSNYLIDTDGALEGFATGCAAAGKDGCALVRYDNTTSTDILARIQGLLDRAHDLSKAGADMSQTLTSPEFRQTIFNYLYAPTAWSAFATFIAGYEASLDALAANTTIPSALALQLVDGKRAYNPGAYASFLAIACGDSLDAGNTTMRDGFDTIVKASQDVSAFFGPRWWEATMSACFAWPARAVERYTGPFDKQLKNPILVIGNSHDPVTPFQNAQLMAYLLGDSAVLLKQDGFGHSSLAEKSSCTVNIINEYFTNGTLPKGNDTECEVDDSVVLFPNSTVTQAVIKRNMLNVLEK
ncbi:TAP-like protein-domain-containing protein [Schizophyllum commune]